MARIPMKGDPPSIGKIAELYGDPADKLAEIYLDTLERAEAASDPHEAAECRKLAERARKDLAKAGLVAVLVEGQAKAVPAAKIK